MGLQVLLTEVHRASQAGASPSAAAAAGPELAGPSGTATGPSELGVLHLIETPKGIATGSRQAQSRPLPVSHEVGFWAGGAVDTGRPGRADVSVGSPRPLLLPH